MKRTTVVSLALFAATMTAAAAAAQPAPAEYVAWYNITVKPGHADQFEEFLGKLKAGADKVGTPQQWGIGQVAFGGPGGAYIVGIPFSSWGEMDAWKLAPQTLKEAYGEEEGAKIYRSGTMAIERSETSVGRMLKDLSYNADSGVVAPMIQIRVSRIHRDKQDQYRVFLQALNEAWKQAGDTRRVIRRVSALGEGSVYTSARMMNRWSDKDSDTDVFATVEKSHGATAARRLRTVLDEAVAETHVFVVAVRPDLSRMEIAATSN